MGLDSAALPSVPCNPMTWGFVASFGGVVAALLVIWVVEQILVRGTVSQSEREDPRAEILSGLDRAEAAIREAREQIEQARIALEKR